MTDDGSITHWLARLQAGDAEAAQQIWNRFSERLLRVARRKLKDGPRRLADEEDVVACAFASLFRRAERGKFPRLNDRNDLWRLLVTIADRKSQNLLRDQRRKKRGGGRVAGNSGVNAGADSSGGGWNQVAGPDPTPEFVATMTETVDSLLGLLDESLRNVVLLKLDGMINPEIASRIDRSRATVERHLKMIRTLWTDWEDENAPL